MKKKQLITDILQVCKISDCGGRDKIFLALAFLSESELIKIAAELNIKTQ